MNKEINEIYKIKCNQCKKDFPKQDIYRIGIKQKEYFCRECANNIKSCCMWCGKELSQKGWAMKGGGNPGGKLAETIDYENLKGERHHVYYLTCEETREHGIRPNQSCPSRSNDWWVEKGKQKRQEKLNKGWKECQGKAIYYPADPKTGSKEWNWDCCKLVPPGEKYCKDESCIYFTAVYKNEHSEKRKRIADKWNRQKEEKYRKANEWWNSLSLEEKQAELKKEEDKLKSLGLVRQRCWIDNWLDQNSILFENDKLYYENMDKIPPSFLDRFGLPGFQWENVWKNDDNRTNALQAQSRKAEIDKEIGNKETSLEQAKKEGKTKQIVKLEQQIKELKSQQNNSDNQIVEPKQPTNYIPWIICGIGALLLIGIGLIVWQKKKKGKKLDN